MFPRHQNTTFNQGEMHTSRDGTCGPADMGKHGGDILLTYLISYTLFSGWIVLGIKHFSILAWDRTHLRTLLPCHLVGPNFWHWTHPFFYGVGTGS
jgi:hypothetical protein